MYCLDRYLSLPPLRLENILVSNLLLKLSFAKMVTFNKIHMNYVKNCMHILKQVVMNSSYPVVDISCILVHLNEGKQTV